VATVKDILKNKGSEVWTISPNATVRKALGLMTEKNIGALVVVDGDAIVGIFSERDYARRAIEEEKFSLTTHVRKLMSSPIYYVTPSQTVDECIALMTQKRFRHLPVIDSGKLVGVVSIGDVVKQSLSELEKSIKDLEDYIWVHLI
jgi:CBS domain-containing protein